MQGTGIVLGRATQFVSALERPRVCKSLYSYSAECGGDTAVFQTSPRRYKVNKRRRNRDERVVLPDRGPRQRLAVHMYPSL